MVSASNYNAFVNSCNRLLSIARTKTFQSAVSLPGNGFNGERFPYSGFPIYPVPQLPASNSNSSQWPNCSSPLSDRSTIQFTPLHFTQLNWTAPLIDLLITSRHGPHREHCFHCYIHCFVRCHRHGPRRKYSFAASPLARWLLPSNGCCLVVCFAVVAYQQIYTPQYKWIYIGGTR
jgi:hypothetical protein